MSEERQLKASEVVSALAALASQGKYDNVTPAASQQMNQLFELVAQVINALEAGEKANEEAEGELAKEQDAAAQANDDEEIASE